jgi:hypothetical protein
MTIKWLMYNDMGNVDHLITHPPTRPPAHSPIYLSTSYLSFYNLYNTYIIIL